MIIHGIKTKRVVLRNTFSLMFLSALLLPGGYFQSIAQEPIVAVPEPLPENPSSSEAQAREQISADIASRVPSDFQIIYYTAPDSSLSDDLFDVLGVRPTTEWQAPTLHGADESVQIAIIDKSALSFVDAEWTREAYRSRVILVGLDLTYDEMVSLTGDQCSGTGSDLKVAHHYWIFQYSYSVELNGEKQATIDESLKQLIDESALESCIADESSDDNRLVERPESVSINQGFYFNPILDKTSIDSLGALLMFLTYQYEMPNPRLQSGHLTELSLN